MNVSGNKRTNGGAAPALLRDPLHQLGEEAADTMALALAALRDSRDASAPAPSRQQLEGATTLCKVGALDVGRRGP